MQKCIKGHFEGNKVGKKQSVTLLTCEAKVLVPYFYFAECTVRAVKSIQSFVLVAKRLCVICCFCIACQGLDSARNVVNLLGGDFLHFAEPTAKISWPLLPLLLLQRRCRCICHEFYVSYCLFCFRTVQAHLHQVAF